MLNEKNRRIEESHRKGFKRLTYGGDSRAHTRHSEHPGVYAYRREEKCLEETNIITICQCPKALLLVFGVEIHLPGCISTTRKIQTIIKEISINEDRSES